jgi:hypothetical protein
MPKVKPAKPAIWCASVVTVNGHALTDGESECLRAAVTAFHSEMSDDNALGGDEHGRLMTRAYRLSMERILALMLG